MAGVRLQPNQSRLETITRKWWLYLLLLVVFFIPSYSAVAVDPRETPLLIKAVMTQAIIYTYPAIWPWFKIAPALLVMAVVVWGNRATRAFDAYVAFTLVLFALLQNSAFTAQYGLAILTGNLLLYLIAATLWAWEAVAPRNDFTPRRRPLWQYWVVPLAVLAFWFPVNTTGETVTPDFNPALLLTSEAGLTFCMMLPVYLTVLALFAPLINRPVARVTSFAGLVTGIMNLLQWFVFDPANWWMGILHLPLVSISLYVLVLSLRSGRTGTAA
jgi:hypothetical protein